MWTIRIIMMSFSLGGGEQNRNNRLRFEIKKKDDLGLSWSILIPLMHSLLSDLSPEIGKSYHH